MDIRVKLVDLENYDVISARTRRGGGGIIRVARVTCAVETKKEGREREREKSLFSRFSFQVERVFNESQLRTHGNSCN